MADIDRYVDTGSDAGGDGTTAATSSGDNTHAYQSVNQCEAAEQADFDTANNSLIVHCNRTNGGGMDTTAVVIEGSTTSEDDTITFQADDFPSDSIYDNTKYTLHNNDSDAVFVSIRDEYISFVNIQVLITEADANTRDGFAFTSLGTAVIYIDSCIIKGVCSGTGVSRGLIVNEADVTLHLFNTQVYGFISGADTGFGGMSVANATNVFAYNCIFYNNYYGIYQWGGTATAINTAIFNCTNDIHGTVTLNYCATDDGDDSDNNGNITITQFADDWAALVVDAAGGDFHVTDASSELYNTGNGGTPKSIFTDDAIGTTRGPADLDWDIGAYELIVAVGAAGIMTTNTGFWGPTF